MSKHLLFSLSDESKIFNERKNEKIISKKNGNYFLRGVFSGSGEYSCSLCPEFSAGKFVAGDSICAKIEFSPAEWNN